MKKLLFLIVSAILLLSSMTVLAQKEYYMEDGLIVFESATDAVISCYDEDGAIAYSNKFTPQDGVIRADVPEKLSQMKMRLYELGKEVVTLVKAENTDVPDETPVVDDKKFPSVYPSEAEANRAFLVCNGVSMVADEDGNNMYRLECFQKGKEAVVLVGTDIKINSAPLANYSIMGMDAGVLKKGDVLRITTNLAKTRVKSIDVMLRAFSDTIATDENNYGGSFRELFAFDGNVGGMSTWKAAEYGKSNNSKYLYAFGIVVDKSPSHISLMDKDGDTSKIMDIDVEKETVVYECDVEEKYTFSPTLVAGITKTFVRSSELDGGIVEWSQYKDFTYAFVRIIDSVATDIVYYHNFR